MMINSEYFKIRESNLGGQGLFAKKFIPKNTCILIEQHLVCTRTFIHKCDDINSYFDFPKIMPPNN